MKERLSEGYAVDFQVAKRHPIPFNPLLTTVSLGPHISLHPRLRDGVPVRLLRSQPEKRPSLPFPRHVRALPNFRVNSGRLRQCVRRSAKCRELPHPHGLDMALV